MKNRNLFEIKDNYYNYYDLKNDNDIVVLKPNDNYKMSFNYENIKNCDNSDLTLQFRGELAINQKWRTEEHYPKLYRRISESLIDGELLIKGDSSPIYRNCFYKIYDNEINGGRNFDFQLDYLMNSNGEAWAEIELFYKTDGKRTVESGNPDKKEKIALEKSADYTFKSIKINATEDVDFIFITIYTFGINGEIRMKSPRLLRSSGQNLIEEFKVLPLELKTPRWIGENLSKIEWIPFKLKLNGELIFAGLKFDRIQVFPIFEFNLPNHLINKGKNDLEIEYCREYESQLDFNLRDTKIISVQSEGIIAFDEAFVVGKNSIMIKTSKNDSKVSISCNNKNIQLTTPTYCFKNSGLNVVELECIGDINSETPIQIDIDNKSYIVKIKRTIQKFDDVLTGSGDSIYINLNQQDMANYLEWYFSSKLGNMITFRTSYRWSGTTYVPNGFWEYINNILLKFNIKFNIMIDGRELNSALTNDWADVNFGDNFLGYQSHEQDGAYYYWNSNNIDRYEVFFNELCGRRFSKTGMLPSGSIIRNGNKYKKHFDSSLATNMQEAAEYYVENLKKITNSATRHTGPSSTFKYFAQAGVEWLGAELMYSTQEPIISALRATSKAYSKPSFGGHIAIQWSSAPHDSVYKYRRYLQSLYINYIKGITEVNTEEGLYRIESYFADFERDSQTCLNYQKCQQKFTEFVKNHNRRGEIKVNIGLLHGKYDGTNMFCKMNTFGVDGSEWKINAPEKSWDLMRKVFYPNAKLKKVYLAHCPNIHVGYFTKTPRGEVDILPLEADINCLNSYPYLALIGFNCCNEALISKLIEYVSQGGKLLLALPHLYTTTSRSQAINHISHILLNDDVKELLGVEEIRRDCKIKLNGGTPCGNKYSVKNSSVICNHIGKGEVKFVNMFAYPSEIKSLYSNLLEDMANENAVQMGEKGFITGKDWISTSIFDSKDRRDIYFVDVKWWRLNKKREEAIITFKGHEYKVATVRDVINICSIFDDIALITADFTTDIIKREGNKITLQGEGASKIKILKEGKIEEIDIVLNGVKEIEIGG